MQGHLLPGIAMVAYITTRDRADLFLIEEIKSFLYYIASISKCIYLEHKEFDIVLNILSNIECVAAKS